jgi:hypothetical protein
VRTRGLLRDGSPSAIALWLPLVLDGSLAYTTRLRGESSVSLGEGAPTRVGGAH